MPIPQVTRVLWAHRRTSLCILAGLLTIAVAAGLLLPKKYVGEAAVVIDARGVDPLADSAMQALLLTSYLATQVDVISSHNVALKVVDRMKLASNPDVISQFDSDTDGTGSIRDWEADELLKKLTVRPPKDSNVIFIRFSSKIPQTAADITNAFADSYIQTSIELKVDPARSQTGWLEQQESDLRANLEGAQRKLSAYQSDHGVIGTNDARLDVENARMTEITDQLVTAQTAMYDANARLRQMNDAESKGRSDELLGVLNNPLLQNLKTDLARSEAKLADVTQRYGRNHPQYMSAQAELDSLRSKVAAEIHNATGTIAREAQIATQNAADLQRAVEHQRQHILALQHNQDEFAVLKQAVDNARTALDAALQRGSRTRLESRLDNANVAILNYAFAPIEPAWPRLILNLALAIVLGGMLSVGVSLMRERWDRRVHSREDLIGAADIAVLAELPRVRRSSTGSHRGPRWPTLRKREEGG